jgi:predicted phosphodiesterase
MTVLYCGDPHGMFDHIVTAAIDMAASAVVLLGDMEARCPLHEALDPIVDRVWFIHGNHDTASEDFWTRVWDSKLAHRNVHGRVVTLPDGTRLAGLGGVFRETVWNPSFPSSAAAHQSQQEHARVTPRQDRWRGGVHRRHWATIYPNEIDSLSKERADVLVTHEAPGYHGYGFLVLDTLARALGVKVAFHGHQHDELDSSKHWTAQQFRSYGVGLRGITAVEPDGRVHVVVPGEATT